MLCFIGSMANGVARAAVASLAERHDWFAARRTHVFVVSADRGDAENDRAVRSAGPYTVFWDFDLAIASLYGMVREDSGTSLVLTGGSIVLDENQRFVSLVPFAGAAPHGDAVAAVIAAIPEFPAGRTLSRQAPVLLIPDVLTGEDCRMLIDAFEADGGIEGDYMTDSSPGMTVGVTDQTHKRRRDWFIQDSEVQQQLRLAIAKRVVPEVKKVFQFSADHLERFLIGRYDGESGDYFRPHRDDNVAGTAHRQFALTINLNTDYEGGDLRFPEYSFDSYRTAAGGAIVFSCTLMHEVTPVTRGQRYAFVSFLLDNVGLERLKASLAS